MSPSESLTWPSALCSSSSGGNWSNWEHQFGFSYEDLAATSRPTRRRVGRTFLFWRVVYALAGAGAVYLGIRGLLG
jgi:hypothetical protein